MNVQRPALKMSGTEDISQIAVVAQLKNFHDNRATPLRRLSAYYVLYSTEERNTFMPHSWHSLDFYATRGLCCQRRKYLG